MAIQTPLGVKRSCPSCSNRFYDLNKNPANCPKCGHSYDPSVQVRTRRSRRITVDSDKQDVLLQHMAKSTPGKAKVKKSEDEIEEFETIGGGSELEEMDDMDDIENLEELEDREEAADDMDDDIALEDEDVGDAVIIDDVEEADAETFEEEEEEAPKKKKSGKRK